MAKSYPTLSEVQVLRIARKSIQALKTYIPGKSIDEVREKYGLKQITKLGSNENPLGASEKVLKAVQAALPHISLYPDGASLALRTALAKTNGITSAEVMVGNGSDEILLMIACAFLNPGEKVLVSENTFSEYEFSGRVLDGKIVKVPLKNFRYDLEAFQKNLKITPKPKLIFLCNPNNPTGNYFTHRELESLLKVTPPQTLVIVDEAYAEYATALDFPLCLVLQKKFPNLIISRTFSKIFGMAGLRLGYCFAHELLIKEIARVKTPFNVNLLVQAGGLAGIADQKFRSRSIKNNTQGRDFLYKAFKKRKIEFLSTEANFICFKTSIPAVALCELLLKQGMIIRALQSFGLDYWNRVTIGTPAQNKLFIQALDAVLS